MKDTRIRFKDIEMKNDGTGRIWIVSVSYDRKTGKCVLQGNYNGQARSINAEEFDEAHYALTQFYGMKYGKLETA